MKNSLLLAAMTALFFVACKNEKSTVAKAENEAPAVVTESELDVAANETDLDFQAAIAAFRKKDFTIAARYIEQAMNDLKKEADTDVKGTATLKQTLNDLESLADKVKKGEIHDEIELQEYYAFVDMMTAHDYLVLAENFDANAPEKSEGAMKKAADRVERASQKLEGEAKNECKTILSDIKADVAKGDQKADAIGDAAGDKVITLEKWLQAHAGKTGIKR